MSYRPPQWDERQRPGAIEVPAGCPLLIIDYAFEAAGVHRVELQVYDFNPRARHVYEKIGFALEGTRRDALRWDGEWVDCHIMGLLARDWRG